MNNEEFYKIDIPLSVRESFNNTILLLTMVKSEYYYIIGFSRKKGQIEIGFDYESDLHRKITETVVVDFYCKDNSVLLSGKINNIDSSDINTLKLHSDCFSVEDNSLVYTFVIPKDKIIPTSISTMNKYILKAKEEIFAFLESYYTECVSGN